MVNVCRLADSAAVTNVQCKIALGLQRGHNYVVTCRIQIVEQIVSQAILYEVKTNDEVHELLGDIESGSLYA